LATSEVSLVAGLVAESVSYALVNGIGTNARFGDVLGTTCQTVNINGIGNCYIYIPDNINDHNIRLLSTISKVSFVGWQLIQMILDQVHRMGLVPFIKNPNGIVYSRLDLYFVCQRLF
jgi:hypothetical protein